MNVGFLKSLVGRRVGRHRVNSDMRLNTLLSHSPVMLALWGNGNGSVGLSPSKCNILLRVGCCYGEE